jgi:hypothetical protein
MNLDEHISQLKQFRQEVYQNFNKRADTMMDLLDALSSNTSANTVVELSLNPAFRREYSSLFTALDEWKPDKAVKNLAQLAGPYLPKPVKQPFWLIGTDVTPQPRIHAPTLEDRSYVYQPNTIKSNKPITVGHAYSSVVLFPEEESEHSPIWVVPLSVKRAASSQDKEMVGAKQVGRLLDDKTLPFHDELCVEVEDSGYSKPAFLAENRKKANLVTIVRARNTRVFYQQPSDLSSDKAAGHPTWYGPRFVLSDETTWPVPEATEITKMVSLSGRTYQVAIEAWDNMLMKGERKPAILSMQEYPFKLVRIRLFNEQGELAFQRPLWLIVMGERHNELSLLQIFDAYQRRYDLEHFFRFGKQRLLLHRYQTPETDHEEKWWQLAHLAYLQLWIARTVAQAVPHPWEVSPANDAKQPLSATHVQRDFWRIIRQIGTPAAKPKRRGNSPGRRKGTVLPHRLHHPVVYKGKSDS